MKKLYLFDFDQTLVLTPASFLIRGFDGECHHTILTDRDLKDYHLKEDEYIDFSQFEDAKFLDPDQVIKLGLFSHFRTLLQDRGVDTKILTARANRTNLINYFKTQGIELRDDQVLCANSYRDFINADDSELTTNAGRKKAIVRDQILKYGYDYVYFADDMQDNLNSVAELGREMNITVITQLA